MTGAGQNTDLEEAAAADAAGSASLDQPLTGFIGYALKRAVSIVQADLARVLAPLGLRAVSFSALAIIVEVPGLTQSALADALEVERSNLVTILDDLAGRGLILRASVANDRRRHALMPTEAGIRLAHVARDAVADHERRLFARLSPADRAALQRILAEFRRTAGA